MHVLSPVLYLTFEEDELAPHLGVVTRILVSIRDAPQLTRFVWLDVLLHDALVHLRMTRQCFRRTDRRCLKYAIVVCIARSRECACAGGQQIYIQSPTSC